MNRDGLVEVPENALVEERIALGLTAPQLGIATGALLCGAALNLLPLWAPAKILLILLLCGSLGLAALLPIRGEPAYRWLLRALRHWRSAKVWRAELVPAVTAKSAVEVSSKRLVSADVQDDLDTAEDDLPPTPRQPADTERSATSTLVATSLQPALVATRSSTAQEQGAMDGSPVRLRLIRPEPPGIDPGAAAPREEHERPPSVPFVLPGPRVVCFLSFAGGTGKTTLAVETATYIAAHARYRIPQGEERAVRTLLIDAARLSAAAGLRLGLNADDLSKTWTYRDWTDPSAVLDARARSRHRVDVITLPPHPQFVGPDRHLAEEAGDEFGTEQAESLLNAARAAAYQLLVVDLGGVLEDGHRVLLREAALIVGVVRPTLESLPDVLRLAKYLRDAGFGRKLVLVANQCPDDAELRRFAHDADVPLIATVPASAMFVAAADRQQPAWALDVRLQDTLLPIARTVWPLDSLTGSHTNGKGPLDRIVRRALRVVKGTRR